MSFTCIISLHLIPTIRVADGMNYQCIKLLHLLSRCQMIDEFVQIIMNASNRESIKQSFYIIRAIHESSTCM